MKNTDTLNLDMSIHFFEDLIGFLKELKTRREQDVAQVISQNIEEKINLDDSLWPEAVPSVLITESIEEKFEKAEGIISQFLSDITPDDKILDYGCGEGCLSFKIKEKFNSKVIGYDIKSIKNDLWESSDKFLTNNFSDVVANAPYDVIIIYDVLDHVIGESPAEVLKKLYDALSPSGKVILRCHPWCGRHGGHLFNQKNKAFLHLVFNEDELLLNGIEAEVNQKVFYPLKTYKSWINDSSFKIISEDTKRQSVENYFIENELIKNRILKEFNTDVFPTFQLEQTFVDFVLKK